MSVVPFSYDLSSVQEFVDIVNNNNNNNNKCNHDETTYLLAKKSSNGDYTVINYENFFPLHLSKHRWFRSVILNRNNRVVCFSPPKSVMTDQFMKQHPDLQNLQMEEFVEGTMINVFWDPALGSWEIATKRVVGANTTFYQPNGKTFRDMFLEACGLPTSSFFEQLNPDLCYSFVLQHPGNRIVKPFQQAVLYLVAAYHIQHTSSEDIKVIPIHVNSLLGLPGVRFPKLYVGYPDYSALINEFASMNTPYDIMGVSIKNVETGERCKIRNPVFEQVRALRGNQPKLQYRYFCLRKEGHLKEYLQYYPEHKGDFSNYRDQLHMFTNTLHQNYLSYFVKKEKTSVDDFPEEYRKHMKALHRKWLQELREQKQPVTKTVVIHYLNNLHPSQIMYAVNYNLVRRCVEYSLVN